MHDRSWRGWNHSKHQPNWPSANSKKLLLLCTLTTRSMPMIAKWQPGSIDVRLFTSELDRARADFMYVQARQAELVGPAFEQLVNEVTSLMNRGGKRLRPQLCAVAYGGYGG